MEKPPYKEAKEFLKDNQPEKYNFELEFSDGKAVETDALKRYFQSKEEVDGSDGKCKLVRNIYDILWYWKSTDAQDKQDAQDAYTDFGKIDYFGTLFGGDVINSVQTVMNFYASKKSKSGRTFSKKDPVNEFKDALKPKIKKFEDYINIYHTIGNFVLVPAYFNKHKGNNSCNDFFDKGLVTLEEKDWHVSEELCKLFKVKYRGSYRKCKNIKKSEVFQWGGAEEILKDMEEIEAKHGANAEINKELADKIEKYVKEKAEKRYPNYKKSDFVKYVNSMFLWDYTIPSDNGYNVKSLCKKKWEKGNYLEYDEKSECRSGEMDLGDIERFISNAQYAIRRRGIFMVAMLRIALGNGDDTFGYQYKGDKQEEWERWDVSGVYKKIMEKVFLDEKKTYSGVSGFGEVIQEIKNTIEEMPDQDKQFVDDILKALTNQLEELDKWLAKKGC